MSDKKRKRESNGTSTPRKRPAVEFKNDKLRISLLGQNDQLPPVLAIATALPDDSLSLAPYVKPARYTAAGRDELLLHSSDHPRLDYIGTEEFGTGADALLKHYVGVYDPETGQLQLVEARRVAVRSVLRKTEQELEEASRGRDFQTMATLRETLGMDFGTKKAKKMISSRAENAVVQSGKGKDQADPAQDAASQAFLDSVAATSALAPSREEMKAAIAQNIPRPKPNLEAANPGEVYSLEVLVSREALQIIDIQDWTEKLEKKEAVSTRSRYVSRRLQSVGRTKDKTKLKTLRYLQLLIEWYQLLMKEMGKGSKRAPRPKELLTRGFSNQLIDNVKKRFTTSNEASKWERDNLVCHAAAISLYIDGFATDMNDLQQDLNLEFNDMFSHFRNLGCRVGSVTEKDRLNLRLEKSEAKSHKMARLQMPLDFPAISLEQRKARARRR